MLVSKDSTLGSYSQSTTDIELYNEATALAAARREVINSKMGIKAFNNLPPSIRDKLNDLLSSISSETAEQKETSSTTDSSSKDKIHKKRLKNICKRKVSDDEKDENGEGACESETIRPTTYRMTDSQRRKANCKSDEILKMKSRCERLIRTCSAGALVKLSVEEFKAMEGETFLI